jgi:hypothetical protein
MLRLIPIAQARLLAMALFASCVWAAASSFANDTSTPISRSTPYGDLQLYRDIAWNVSKGESYYSAATNLHRKHHYPTAPFVTVRLPTLALAAAALGWTKLHLLLVALLSACAYVWFRRIGKDTTKAEQVGAAVMIICGGILVSQSWAVLHHDLWAGVLLTLATPLRGGRAWPLAIFCAAFAVAVRELAFPFVLLSLCAAALERRSVEFVAWAALTVAFIAGMAWHAYQVHAYAFPTDLHSPGWTGMLGPAGSIAAVVEVSPLKLLPPVVAAPLAVLAVFGWFGLPRMKLALFTVFWLLSFAAGIALFARENSGYWAMELTPAWLIGLVFLPRATVELLSAAGIRRSQAHLV